MQQKLIAHRFPQRSYDLCLVCGTILTSGTTNSGVVIAISLAYAPGYSRQVNTGRRSGAFKLGEGKRCDHQS